MVESEQILTANNKDNFNKVLSVFPYNSVENADAVKSKLDKAIEKVSVVIKNHRVSHWTDDCYLLLAKAQYLKKDFETSEESYRYFLDEFDPLKNRIRAKKIKENTRKEKKKKAEDLKKERQKAAKEKAKERKKLMKERAANRKRGIKTPKEKAKPEVVEIIKPVAVVEKEDQSKLTNEGSWWNPHYPAYWEGSIWAGKNLVERGKPFEAERLFRRVENDPYASADLKEELYASYADLYLKTQNYSKAIRYLQLAIEFGENKKRKARYAYILGQLYQNEGRNESANDYFAQCIKWKPSYDLVIHARLNILLNDAAAGASPDEIAEKINKLIDDPKNSEFMGELHYSLGMIYLKQKQEDLAVEQFNNSIRSPKASNLQKAESYYQLAGLHFEKQNYLDAKLYYDSTMTNLAKTDERRIEVGKIVSNLEEIAKHLQNIAHQDSLLKLSQLSVQEKRALAIQIKNSSKKKAAVAEANPVKSKFAQLDALSANPFSKETAGFDDKKKSTSSFFGYDQRSINRGRSDFEQVWGTRILEDNWRRSNKTSFVSETAFKNEQKETESDTLEFDLAQVLKGIPESPAQIEEARKSIEESKYQLALLYREKLENYPKSTTGFKELLKEYPQTQRKPDALYYLYLNCLDLDDSGCANSYKDQIAYEYPGSHYAKVLTDPEYAKSLMAQRDELSNHYHKAYDLYASRNYSEAFEMLQIVKNRLPSGHKLLAKVALLTAFCVGNIEGKEVYINSLKEVIANYPSTDEEVKAKEILRFMKGDEDAFITIRQSEMDKTNYKAEDDKMHFVIVTLFNPEDKVVDKAKISISDYHENYHKLDRLKMTSVELDIESNNPIIIIRKFDNKDQAMEYYKGVTRKPNEYILDFNNWEIMAISQNNYREVLRLKSLTEYKTFFKTHYLNEN